MDGNSNNHDLKKKFPTLYSLYHVENENYVTNETIFEQTSFQIFLILVIDNHLNSGWSPQ